MPRLAEMVTGVICYDDTYFDLNSSGFGDRTGWIGPCIGVLSLDANNDGRINDIAGFFGQWFQDDETARELSVPSC